MNVLAPLIGVLILLLLLVIVVIIALISIIHLRMRYYLTMASFEEALQVKCLYFLIGNPAITGKDMTILNWYVYTIIFITFIM